MSRRVLPALLLMTAVSLAAAEQGQLDASPSLFSVLAAINAAGYDADLDSPANNPLREMVRKELTARQVPSLAALRQFFAEHRQKDWPAELSQYVSFALSVEDPPDFKYRFPVNQLPPDVFPLQGFEKLLARFHREANLEELWRKAQPAYERAIARYHEPVSRAVLEVNAYLRNPTSGSLGRRFQVYVDLLGAPNQIHTRSYADDYFVVVTPSPEPQTADVRHAYLHYLLDPVLMRHSEAVNKKKALIDYALGARLLEESFKQDFLLLATECLVKAVEARLAPRYSGRQALVEQALREGYILTPHFAESLPGYEKQEQAMRFYFPELANAIDLKREQQRLDKVEFAQQRAVRKAKTVPPEKKPELAGSQKLLEEAEQLYNGRELEKAREGFLRVLRETDEKPLHARSYYGLARIAALQKDPELAQKLFQRTLESSPDAQVKAWAHVYLARLAEAAGERPQAEEQYRAALAVAGASE
ncbi:MAG: tetratricopeptide repeat protein, partial [Acidobacteriota bacterium]